MTSAPSVRVAWEHEASDDQDADGETQGVLTEQTALGDPGAQGPFADQRADLDEVA